jgi:hypothetical protein
MPATRFRPLRPLNQTTMDGMADTGVEDVEKQALLAFLDAQRAIVLAIVADTLATSTSHANWPTTAPGLASAT